MPQAVKVVAESQILGRDVDEHKFDCHSDDGQLNGHTKMGGACDVTNGHVTDGVSAVRRDPLALKARLHAAKPTNAASNAHPNPHEEQFMSRIFSLIQEILRDTRDVNSKVLNFKHPDELQKLLDLQLKEEGESDDRILDLCRTTARYSVKTGHPRFFNQLFAALDTYGLAGELVTDVLNASQYTYEVAPVFTLMEDVLVQKMCKMVGWDGGDGIFAPGGSICNLYAVNLGRYYKFPEVKDKGLCALPPTCMFTSSHCHYSIRKTAAALGIGMDNCIKVPVDDRGKMDLVELERLVIDAKDRGLLPFFVNATAGTTVVGAIDPLDGVADLCEKYGMWMHVDAAWGGGIMASENQRYKVKGIERADSVTWDPHKMMNAPLQCCVILTRHKNLLGNCNSAAASYLFQQDKFYDVSYDTGDKSLQCSRNVDVFKLWLMWKSRGDKGFQEGIDNIFDCAMYLTEQCKIKDGFRMVYGEPEATNVCFWYIPPRLRGRPETAEWWAELHKVAPKIKARMMQQGTTMINYQPLDDKVNFFRMVVIRHSVTREDMDFVMNEIERLGQDL